jgi:two-component system cell cycle response regulator
MKIEPLEQELQQKLPSPQGVAMAILDACKKEDSSIFDIALLVQSDPALSGRLLKHANSAATGARPVASVQDAVNRLGISTVRNLALAFSLVDQHGRGNCADFDYQRYWSQSLLVGLVMKELGPVLHLGVVDELFTLGLLSRVGTLALATAYPVEYAGILRDLGSDSELQKLERSRLDIDHLQLSAALMKDWGLPEVLISSVLYSDATENELSLTPTRTQRLAGALRLSLHVADLAHCNEAERSKHMSTLEECSVKLGIAVTDLGELVDRAVAQSHFWSDLLKVQVAEMPSFKTLKDATRNSGLDESILRILVVEDDPVLRKLLETWLMAEKHHSVTIACDGKEALGIALQTEPHVVVTDWKMPHMNGVELCAAIRASEWGQKIYVLMLTGMDQEDDLVMAYEAGVDEFISKPINRRAFNARLKGVTRYVRLRDAWERDRDRLTQMATELALSNRRHQLASLTDLLTDISNRRAGQMALSQAISTSERYGTPTTILSIDVDHFKRVNDTLGHAAGDLVLINIAKTLKAVARKEDTVCRWGGEEFMIVAPNITLKDGVAAAQRLRKIIANQKFEFEGKKINVAVSVGVTSWSKDIKNEDELLVNADKALYAVKSGGRNAVAVSENGKVRIV